ncbi:inositol-tetrakisphosphate 1-kinase-like [Phymastichus coffea]|uniref:inositol-tetrakisphosphate 1-kinase-like n=1 Tax=Phymastichus coffea TaxID=108790 RepID=UPI00273CB0FE|nr:inositol-tetrakisphosphate 1-kinase-like [Phymastichus coffea]
MGDEKNVIGYWISEKKRQKFNWEEFHEEFAKKGLLLKLIDIESNLECQGPFHVFLHKLTDILAHAEDGNKHAKAIISRIQDYIQKDPQLIVIDPIENVLNLRNRHKCYKMLRDELLYDDDVFIPNFTEIKSKDVQEIMNSFKKYRVDFPCVCKPLIAHGSSDAHKMMIVFNEEGLLDCQPPCVAHNLVNHNAILYKIFVVDEHFHVVERPSLKNFYSKDCQSMSTIFFSSHDISKSGSNSKWSIISEDERNLSVKPNFQTFEKIVKRIRKIFGLLLMGVDVVIENHTEKYAIIDVNVFPGYDGYPNFFQQLASSIKKLLNERRTAEYGKCPFLKKCLSDDLDSGFESDEKKKLSLL